jgi:hypothetical protein
MTARLKMLRTQRELVERLGKTAMSILGEDFPNPRHRKMNVLHNGFILYQKGLTVAAALRVGV